MTEKYSSPMNFPCDFDIKVMGHSTPEFKKKIAIIIKRHFSDFNEEMIKSRNSKDKNYLALTLTVKAKNQAQLDSCYEELSASTDVIMAL